MSSWIRLVRFRVHVLRSTVLPDLLYRVLTCTSSLCSSLTHLRICFQLFGSCNMPCFSPGTSCLILTADSASCWDSEAALKELHGKLDDDHDGEVEMRETSAVSMRELSCSLKLSNMSIPTHKSKDTLAFVGFDTAAYVCVFDILYFFFYVIARTKTEIWFVRFV